MKSSTAIEPAMSHARRALAAGTSEPASRLLGLRRMLTLLIALGLAAPTVISCGGDGEAPEGAAEGEQAAEEGEDSAEGADNSKAGTDTLAAAQALAEEEFYDRPKEQALSAIAADVIESFADMRVKRLAHYTPKRLWKKLSYLKLGTPFHKRTFDQHDWRMTTAKGWSGEILSLREKPLSAKQQKRLRRRMKKSFEESRAMAHFANLGPTSCAVVELMKLDGEWFFDDFRSLDCEEYAAWGTERAVGPVPKLVLPTMEDIGGEAGAAEGEGGSEDDAKAAQKEAEEALKGS